MLGRHRPGSEGNLASDQEMNQDAGQNPETEAPKQEKEYLCAEVATKILSLQPKTRQTT